MHPIEEVQGVNTGCGALRDFFISYSRADSAWAIWIAWVLEEHGYTCLLDQWDFQRGGNWVLEMHRATRETKRTLVVLSSNYLAAQFTQAEWTSAFKRDPTGEQGLIVPVRVEECEGEGVLGQTLYIELVGKEERAARRALLDGVRQQRSKPVDPPTFPAAVPKGDRAVPKPPSFPGSQRNGSHSKPHPFPGPSPIMSRVFAAATLLSPLVAALVAGILMGWDHPLRYFLSPLAIETRWWDRSPAVPLGNQTLGFYGDRNNNEVAMGLEKKMSRRFEVDTGIKVDPLDNPQPEDRLPIARNAIRSGKYDAVMIDIVWAGELAPDLVDLKPFFEESEIEQHSQEIINNNTIGGAPVAIPWFQEIGLLYYRNDLLERDNEKFDTWEALEEAATRIQEKEKSKMPDFNGFALQGSDHEGLTCNALEWIASWGGLDTNTGKILFNNEGVLEALDRARKWVNGERAISRDAKGFEEEGSLQMFLHGKAAFLRSWTSAYAKLKQARIPFEVAPLPRGKSDRSFGVVGGWQLAVPKKSPNKPSAIEFIRYLSSPGVQRWRAREGAYQPTMQKLDEELDVANALPRVNMKDIQPIIRPSSQLGDRYDEVSKCIYNSVRAALDSKSRHEIKQYIVNMKNCVESNEPPKVDR